MNLRDALVQQSPSLALQRAAADEIASLDARLSFSLRELSIKTKMLWDIEDYLEAHDLTKEFEEWLARNIEP